jgi:hypothetical protein
MTVEVPKTSVAAIRTDTTTIVIRFISYLLSFFVFVLWYHSNLPSPNHSAGFIPVDLENNGYVLPPDIGLLHLAHYLSGITARKDPDVLVAGSKW